MRNKYPGICYRCGKTVEARQGHFERLKKLTDGSYWRTQHAECAIKYRNTSVHYITNPIRK